jgi:hypothetical protein
VDHVTGRWLARDAVRFKAGSMNLFLHAGADPLNAVDATGLATYRCRKPIRGGHFENDRGGPGLLYHEYVCIWQGNTPMCNGQSGNGLFIGPGHPSNDYWNPALCDEVREDDLCFESCTAGHLLGERSFYEFTGTFGENCQGFADRILNDCDAKCSQSLP